MDEYTLLSNLYFQGVFGFKGGTPLDGKPREMDRLPWHLQLDVYKRIDRDTLRGLGVRPGRLSIPKSLQTALNRSIACKSSNENRSQVVIPIARTGRTYHLFRRVEDDDGQIDCDVMVRDGTETTEHVILYRADGHRLSRMVDLLLRSGGATLINLEMV